MNYKIASILFIFLMISITSLQAQTGKYIPNDSSFTFRDNRDRKIYSAIIIGQQAWMAENLRYKAGDSWCYFNKKKNCKKYGRLYGWDAAQTACPAGWHLPANIEWQQLIDYLGGDKKAGFNLALDFNLGFDIVFGYPPNINGRFNAEGTQTNFWSATANNNETAWSYYLLKDKLPLVFKSYFSKNYNLSCRCVQDKTYEIKEHLVLPD